MIIKEFANAYHPASTLISVRLWNFKDGGTVKLGDKENFDKEQIGVSEQLHVTNCQFTT